MKTIKINGFKDSQLVLACSAVKHICKGKKVVLDATGCMGNMIAVSTIAEAERILKSNGMKMQTVPQSDDPIESIASNCREEIRVLWTLSLADGERPIA